MSAKEYTGADEVLAKIKTYKDDFRADAEEIHNIIVNSAEDVFPRLWYGMPGYAKSKTGPVVVYFRKDKYITFGKTESAEFTFDADGAPVPTAWFADSLSPATKALIAELASSTLK